MLKCTYLYLLTRVMLVSSCCYLISFACFCAFQGIIDLRTYLTSICMHWKGHRDLEKQGIARQRATVAWKWIRGTNRHFRPDEPTYGPDEVLIFTPKWSSEPAEAVHSLRPEQAKLSSGRELQELRKKHATESRI